MDLARVRHGGPTVILVNRTGLDDARLDRMLHEAVIGWPHERLTVRVRFSRGADYSGTFLRSRRVIYVNLGRHVRYPYRLETYVARARSNRTHWWKPACGLQLADAYQLALFVFLHEFYHWLVTKARRNGRQKESMCDRFAVRGLVELTGLQVTDGKGRPVDRSTWDFQDLDRFVARARPKRRPTPAAEPKKPRPTIGQLYLFDVA
jgi:hypothetical protein